MSFDELLTHLRAVITFAPMTPEAKEILDITFDEIVKLRTAIDQVNEIQHTALSTLFDHYTGEERRKAQQEYDGPDRRCPCDKYNHVYEAIEEIHAIVHDIVHEDDKLV